jgi:DDE superfamily endonuclease/Helix-turn-helix of DDE superfamily endonuclease
MYAITGLSDTQMVELVSRLKHTGAWDRPGGGRPCCVDLHDAVTVALVYLRRNLAQEALGELFGISQASVSRIIATLLGPIEAVLAGEVPKIEDLPEQLVFVLDGTLTPCWSYEGHPELYSGKHHTTGHNHQVACDAVHGELAWISDPLPGSTHDKAAFDHHHVGDHLDPARIVADKGYQGTGAITPTKKPPNRELAKSDRQRNESIGKIRYLIERANANIKTWRILHTDYRRPLHTYIQAFRTTRALIFFTKTYE